MIERRDQAADSAFKFNVKINFKFEAKVNRLELFVEFAKESRTL